MKRLYLVLLFTLAIYVLICQVNPITVISPNGGEDWQIGSTHSITWSTTLVSGAVNIYLVRSNSMAVVYNIVMNIPINAGVYNWSIPATVPPATDYKVGVALNSTAGPIYTIFDLSDAVFSISSSVPSPHITVISPNGGENWTIGSTHPITWNYSGLSGEVRIDLVSPLESFAPNTIATVPINDLVYYWTIPNSVVPLSLYQISITWVSILTVYIGDLSDSTITISAPTGAPAITVISPNGGENWLKGSTHPITWSSESLTGNVQILLVGANNATTMAQVIARDIPNTGIFNWTILPVVPAGTSYKVMVRSLANPGIMDLSDNYFTIADPYIGRLRVIAPNGGENWHRGLTYNIRWSYLSPSTSVRVEIALINYGSNAILPYLIAPSALNTGIFSWTIPPNLPLGRYYKVRIRALNTLGMVDLSDAYFAITGNTITLAGIVKHPDGSVLLSLETSDATPVSVSIYNIKGQCVRTLLSNEPINGKRSLVWDGKNADGNKIRRGDYLVRIKSETSDQVRKFRY